MREYMKRQVGEQNTFENIRQAILCSLYRTPGNLDNVDIGHRRFSFQQSMAVVHLDLFPVVL